MQLSARTIRSLRAALEQATALLHNRERASVPPPAGSLTIDGGLRMYARLASAQLKQQRTPVRAAAACHAPELSYTQQHVQRCQRLAKQAGVRVEHTIHDSPTRAEWR